MARSATSPRTKRAAAAAAKPAARPARRATASGAAGRAPARPAAPAAPDAAGTVAIRMYRGLLGDFFLIRHTVDERRFHMLIDCGVLQCIGRAQDKPSTAAGKARIAAGVADLVTDTGGQLDLVVATHEHYDHLSGFILAAAAFAPVTIGKVWMAWTEDRGDEVANRYRRKKGKALAALAALAQNPALSGSAAMATVVNLLQFHGGADTIRGGPLAAAGGGALPGNASCEAALGWLRTKAGADNVAFLKPGQALRWGVDDAFHAYVLGPPRENEELMRKLDPSGKGRSEVYLARGEDVETVASLAALHGAAAGAEQLEDQPFARPYRRPYRPRAARGTKPARIAGDPIVALYESKTRVARGARIDDDWLGAAEDLALKIDGDVNNTSLALALEVTEKRVLLFPADAQVGNWLSWREQTYPAGDGGAGDGARATVDELLARTVFYKVGHHASHNATLRERGLELMTDPRLCAMIPVVEKTAQEQKTRSAPTGWAMPYGDLYKRLEERTAGRILRGDGDVATETARFRGSIFGLAFGPRVAPGDPLWAELTLPV